MKTLLILRHAKSSKDDPRLPDHDRPLNERGLKNAQQLGTILSKEGLMPDFILTSTAKRALDTANLVAKHSGYQGEIKSTQNLYEADIAGHVAVVQKAPDNFSSVMVAGHNPFLEEWVSRLTGTQQSLGTANLAKIELPIKHWKEFSTDTKGRLIKLWQP